MGGQLSSSSPGLSSLGSNGQQSRHGRSPPPNSASQSSLALCSSASSSGGRHSAALIRGIGGRPLHSPPSASSSFGGRLLISPPIFRRHDQSTGRAKGSLSRWGSFTRALPALVRGGNSGRHHHLAKEQKRHLTAATAAAANGNGVISNKFGGVDPNNNNNGPYLPQQAAYYEQSRLKNLWSSNEEEDEGVEDEDDEEDAVASTNKERHIGHEFSLKTSLKKSGSRLFKGILRGGYLRTLLGDEEEEDDEEEEGEEEQIEEAEDDEETSESTRRKQREEEEEEEEEERRRKAQHRREERNADLLNNNNGPMPNGHFASVGNRLRPSNSFFYEQQPPLPAHKQQQQSISTSALRSSLRQVKRHFLLPGAGNNNGGGGRNGLMSSMLLAMAAGQPPPPVARPFSFPQQSDLVTPLMMDWNGNNAASSRNATGLHRKKQVIQASSSELIRALGQFICQHCRSDLLGQFEPAQLSTWLRGVDRALILQGWQDIAFINPANLVFVFMLIREAFAHGECQRLSSLRELHSFVLMCLYISYSYMGNEISYPLKPFITENTNRGLFWSQCVRLIKAHSGQMLRLNSSSTFFLDVFTELKDYLPQPNTYYPY